MFSTTGLFRDITCPKGADCALLGCIFSHDASENKPVQSTIVESSSIDNSALGESGEPLLKRRRLTEPAKQILHQQNGNERSSEPPSRNHSVSTFPSSKQLRNSTGTLNSLGNSAAGARPSLLSRGVSPPSIPVKKRVVVAQRTLPLSPRSGSQVGSAKLSAPKENLTPRALIQNPAPYPQRLSILKKIHEQIMRLNNEARGDPTTKDTFLLSAAETVTMALDEEEKIARDNPQIYKNIIGHRIVRLKKMKLDEWKDSLLVHFKKKYEFAEVAKLEAASTLDTGLTTQQELSMLAHVLTPLKGLETYGYVTSPPTPEQVKAAQDGVEAAGGFERCDRCKSRFRVFPGRDSDENSTTFGKLTSTENGCTYHWARPFKPPKLSKAAADQEATFPCCHGSIGATGCTVAPHHVFKASDVHRMASMMQFKETPELSDPSKSHTPVTFDCEMGYTTMGMELIRLTAISWPQNKPLLDVLVRPLGEIIDFNTRFSGVSQEQFAQALHTSSEGGGGDTSKPSSEDGEVEEEPLRLVRSPMEARKLLFDLLTPETPLIGHAIDNDLNTCRIIHPTIVDTVLLFPHPRGLPMRFGLKMLAGKYLQRGIQAAGASGHDSLEDAKATADLVRVKVGEKWKQMKSTGWKFNGDVLVPPLETTSKTHEVAMGVKRAATEMDRDERLEDVQSA